MGRADISASQCRSRHFLRTPKIKVTDLQNMEAESDKPGCRPAARYLAKTPCPIIEPRKPDFTTTTTSGGGGKPSFSLRTKCSGGTTLFLDARRSRSFSGPLFRLSRDYRHKKPPKPGMCCYSTREGQPFFPLEPTARLARALVELGPRHALAPEIGSRHGALHSSRPPRAGSGTTNN